MIRKLHKLPPQVHFVYGDLTWIRREGGMEVCEAIQNYNQRSDIEYPIKCSLTSVKEAQHLLIVTHAKKVLRIINKIMANVSNPDEINDQEEKLDEKMECNYSRIELLTKSMGTKSENGPETDARKVKIRPKKQRTKKINKDEN